MTRRRLSRVAPYVLTATDVEHSLSALTPAVEVAIAALFKMTPEDWREQPDRLKIKQLIDFQTSGQIAASLVVAARAQADLIETATAAIDPNTDGIIQPHA